MKIAIKGHESRGKEVIQILESLGGKNKWFHEGINEECFYELHEDCIWCANTRSEYFKYYTLEEFEEEFPFKIGDKVMDCSDNEIGIITNLINIDDELYYNVDFVNSGQAFMLPKQLKPFKEMKEERNITLTLDKAKEWYKKGGELKEVALQAYSEKELTKVELPKTWEEFCEKYPVKKGECWLSGCDAIRIETFSEKRTYKNWIPSQKSAEAHLALIQLEQLRDCYNDNSDAWEWSYSIIKRNGIPELVRGCDHDTFLRFNNGAIAMQFLNCFRDLIEKAGDLI